MIKSGCVDTLYGGRRERERERVVGFTKFAGPFSVDRPPDRPPDLSLFLALRGILLWEFMTLIFGEW